MKIIFDAMGGDLAPRENIIGAMQAVAQYDIEVVLVGDKERIDEIVSKENIDMNKISIVDAPLVIPMDVDPALIMKDYYESSLATGLKLIASGEGDAFVSAGSTGAMLFGSIFIVKRIKGIKRPAIGTMVPYGGGKFYMLTDAGANHDCRAQMLDQFALMGSVYFEKVFKTPHPRVGLVNIGSEEHKGDDLRRESNEILKHNKAINYIGNIEARDLPTGGCDVAVCDGFTGNIILKLSEGFGTFFKATLKEMLTATVGTKIAAVLLKKELTSFKKVLDYKEQGGAPLLGVRHPVIKAHGSSDARAFKNAIRQAVACVEYKVVETIAQGVANQDAEEE